MARGGLDERAVHTALGVLMTIRERALDIDTDLLAALPNLGARSTQQAVERLVEAAADAARAVDFAAAARADTLRAAARLQQSAEEDVVRLLDRDGMPWHP